MTTRVGFLVKAEAYLNYRRKLGFQLKVEGGELLRFACYADQIRHRGPLTTDLALDWARLAKDRSRLYQARRLEVVRCFAKYLAVFDARTAIPGNRLLGPAHRRIQPHIYSMEEIRRLVRAASTLAPQEGLRPRTFAVLVGLLASTGLRPSEALNLVRDDVDLQGGVLTIRETKFHKSRLVPIQPTVARTLRGYARFRDGRHPFPRSQAFLINERGIRLPHRTVAWTFRRLCAAAQVGSEPGLRRPRLYDLRHTFACRRLLEWHREGVDVDQAMPALSTYLGHVKVTDTYWYLSGIPELLAIVGSKFERYAHHHEGGAP